jgi:hypothetical protein
MKLSIKDIMCEITIVNNKFYITDLDANRVINLSKSLRGRKITKERLCNLDVKSYHNGKLCFELDARHIDKCYGNKKVLNTLLPIAE